ncbi:MAG: NUDIX domain-containing protein [Lachnospiraceae bacterium]|nr:NUDIX domain-containing protein [Lachnospiraceae bacterium]
MKLIDKIALLYLKEGRILSTRSRGKDVYYIPGGKREAGESDLQTLVREIREELCVDIQKDTVHYYGTFEAQAHGHAEGILVRMTCYMAEFTGTPRPDHEIAEIVWLTTEDMDRISPVDKLIFQDLKEKGWLI